MKVLGLWGQLEAGILQNLEEAKTTTELPLRQ